jgi:hypothetical protein
MAEAAANTHEREVFTNLQRSWSRLARNLRVETDTIPRDARLRLGPGALPTKAPGIASHD